MEFSSENLKIFLNQCLQKLTQKEKPIHFTSLSIYPIIGTKSRVMYVLTKYFNTYMTIKIHKNIVTAYFIK